MTDAKALRRIRLFLFLAVVLLAIAAFADSLAPHDPYLQDLDLSLLPPGGTYPLGTDRFGRCVLSRVIAGSTISIYASLAVVALTFVLGTVTGLVAGFSGGWIDTALMRITDVFLAFPVLVFAIVAAAMFSGIGGAQFSGLTGAILALALISWPKYARLVRSQVLAVRNKPFISAARFSGCSKADILFRQILPLAIAPTFLMMTADIGTMLLEMAGLSFLGLGVQPPAAEWGLMISSGRSLLQTAPWVIFAPGAALFITVTIFNLLGDSIHDYMETRFGKGD